MTQSKAIEQGGSTLSGAERERIIRKIKRCLALSQSSNTNEAEMAMRQAQKMMQEYRLGEADVMASDVGTAMRATGLVRMSDWQRSLADTAARAFNCKFLMSHIPGLQVDFIFVGVMPAAELAAYAYDSLLAQIKRDRKAFCGGYRLPRSVADDFCTGWVYMVGSKLQQFAKENTTGTANALMVIQQREDAAIDAWIEQSHGKVKERKAAKKNHCKEAIVMGAAKGRDAEIRQAVTGAPTKATALLT